VPKGWALKIVEVSSHPNCRRRATADRPRISSSADGARVIDVLDRVQLVLVPFAGLAAAVSQHDRTPRRIAAFFENGSPATSKSRFTLPYQPPGETEEHDRMWLYAQVWLPLLTISLAAALCFGVASFFMRSVPRH
jgi:hypothetical protein